MHCYKNMLEGLNGNLVMELFFYEYVPKSQNVLLTIYYRPMSVYAWHRYHLTPIFRIFTEVRKMNFLDFLENFRITCNLYIIYI